MQNANVSDYAPIDPNGYFENNMTDNSYHETGWGVGVWVDVGARGCVAMRSYPDETSGIGMSRCTRYTRVQGGTSARILATKSISTEGGYDLYRPVFQSSYLMMCVVL